MCDISIVTLFANKAWDGLIKYEDYVLINKNITKYAYGNVSFSLILKNVKTNKYYQVLYTTIYTSYYNFEVTINKITEVVEEPIQTTVWRTGDEILDDIIKSIK